MKWKANTVLCVKVAMQLPAGELTRLQLRPGDELVYEGCKTIEGIVFRLFRFGEIPLWECDPRLIPSNFVFPE